jgi:DNA-directed RNA polymerase specialized sigma subunit
MTDTAFKKKREKTHKDFADVYTKAAYDMYPSEMIKKLKEKDNVLKEKDNVLKEKDNVLKEKDNVLKEKDNVLKEKDEILNRLIIRLYFQEQKTKESIAELVGLPIETIDNIILNSKTA